MAAIEEFLTDLEKDIKSHRRLRRIDAGLHQFLVIGAAIAGFVSLAVGLLQHPVLAGVIAGLTSVAAILSQQLHCVKAIDWHARMLTELEGIRSRLLFEGADVAELSKERRDLKLRMTNEWEKISRAPAQTPGEWQGQESEPHGA